jgi:hypothetical protein
LLLFAKNKIQDQTDTNGVTNFVFWLSLVARTSWFVRFITDCWSRTHTVIQMNFIAESSVRTVLWYPLNHKFDLRVLSFPLVITNNMGRIKTNLQRWIILSHVPPVTFFSSLHLRFFLWLDSPIWAWASSLCRGFMVTHIWDTPQSVGLLWTRDQLVAETSTWQHTTLIRDRHPCPRWDFFFACPGFFPFDPFLYCLNPFVLLVTLRSILPSLQQTQHKHPCPRWDFFLF